MTAVVLIIGCSTPLKKHTSTIDPESQTTAIVEEQGGTLQTPKTTTSARRSKIHQTAWNSSVGCAADFETVGWEGRAAGEDVAALGGGVFCS